MLIDGLNLAEGSSAQNFTISSGTSFPLTASEGEAFYRNDGANEGLYLYDGVTWIQAGLEASATQSITGLWSFTQPVSGVSPISASDLTTKQYVDNIATGLDVKLSVKAATTANIALSGTQTIDGVSVLAGDRVLVKDQSFSTDNGIYVVSAGAWARSTDADNSPVGEVTSGMFTLVTSGTANANKGFVLTSADPIALGSTALVFTQFSGGTAVPTLTSTQIGFGSGTNTLTGSTKFTWDDAASTLQLAITGSGSNSILQGVNGGGALTIRGGATQTLGTAGNVIIHGANISSGAIAGGNVTISGGTSTGTAGYLVLATAATERLRILPSGAWSVGTGGTATGTSGQALVSNGNAPPTWQTLAISATAESLTGTTIASNVVTAALRTVQPTTGANLVVSGGNSLTNGVAGALYLRGGPGSVANGTATAGAVHVLGGSVSGSGPATNSIAGDVNVTGGAGWPGSGGTTGGIITISGGNGAYGGGVNINGGTSSANTAGDVKISGGTGTVAGNIMLYSGANERLRILANGAWSVGTGGTATGTSGQVLTSTGATTTPIWQTSAGAATTSANTWTQTQTFSGAGQAIIVGTSSTQGTIQSFAGQALFIAPLAASSGIGGALSLIGGNGGGTSSSGGQVTVRGGQAATNGTSGDAILQGGNAYPGGASIGGNAVVQGGTGQTSTGAGSVMIQGGLTSNGPGPGGNVILLNGYDTGGASIPGYVAIRTTNSNGIGMTERLRITKDGAWSIGSTGTAYGTSGQVLTSNGNAAPTWSAPAVSSVAGRTGAVTLTVADIPDAQPKTLGLVSQSADYTCVLADSGKVILHPAADTVARAFTIPANASVPYPIGTVITFINQNGGGVISIAITTDVMRLAGPGTVGTRTLAANGLATATKIAASEWIISGVGLT